MPENELKEIRITVERQDGRRVTYILGNGMEQALRITPAAQLQGLHPVRLEIVGVLEGWKAG